MTQYQCSIALKNAYFWPTKNDQFGAFTFTTATFSSKHQQKSYYRIRNLQCLSFQMPPKWASRRLELILQGSPKLQHFWVQIKSIFSQIFSKIAVFNSPTAILKQNYQKTTLQNIKKWPRLLLQPKKWPKQSFVELKGPT